MQQGLLQGRENCDVHTGVNFFAKEKTESHYDRLLGSEPTSLVGISAVGGVKDGLKDDGGMILQAP